MFNKDFYPTPIEIIEKMLDPYINEGGKFYKFKNILEPSAGKGDIIDYIKGKTNTINKNFYVYEKDFDLSLILKGKGVNYLGDDFLDSEKDLNFDLIIMNPPFSKGVEHLLQAWEIAGNTEIVCLLNSETILNPYSKNRKLLKKIIQDNNGIVEHLGDCFTNAERTTGVEVSLIRLSKKSNDMDFDFELDTEMEEKIQDDYLEKGIMTNDKIESIIAQYEESKKLMKQILKSISKLNSYINQIAPYQESKIFDIICGYGTNQDKYNRFITTIKSGTWKELINQSNMEKYMTSKLKNNFSRFIEEQGNVAITKNNINKFIEFVLLNNKGILENSIEEVFDELTRYSKENRFYPEGWKTNDNWKVNRKIILGYFGLEYDEQFGFSIYSSDKLDNLDKVLCYIDGRDFNKCYTVLKALENNINNGSGNRYESDFFNFKFYKKCSIHLVFKDEDLWKEFNYRACNMKNWLPENEKKEHQIKNKLLNKQNI